MANIVELLSPLVTCASNLVDENKEHQYNCDKNICNDKEIQKPKPSTTPKNQSKPESIKKRQKSKGIKKNKGDKKKTVVKISKPKVTKKNFL